MLLCWLVSVIFSIASVVCFSRENLFKQSDKEATDDGLMALEDGDRLYNQIAVPGSNYYRNIQCYIQVPDPFNFGTSLMSLSVSTVSRRV